MAWTAPKTYVAGAVLTAAEKNTYERDNFIAVRGGGLALASQATGDVLYAASATQFGRLAAGAPGSVLKANGPGAPPSWGPSPIAMAIVFGG